MAKKKSKLGVKDNKKCLRSPVSYQRQISKSVFNIRFYLLTLERKYLKPTWTRPSGNLGKRSPSGT